MPDQPGPVDPAPPADPPPPGNDGCLVFLMQLVIEVLSWIFLSPR